MVRQILCNLMIWCMIFLCKMQNQMLSAGEIKPKIRNLSLFFTSPMYFVCTVRGKIDVDF